MPVNSTAGLMVRKLIAFAVLASIAGAIAGCGQLPATVPAPTSTSAPTSLPTSTLAPTPAPPVATDTVAVETPTPASAATPTEVAAVTPQATEGPILGQWSQTGLAGTALTSLSIFLQGPDPVLLAGAKGAWLSRYPYSDWQQQKMQFSAGGRTSSAAVADANVMYLSNNTGCASGAPIGTLRTEDGGQTWKAMSIEAIAFAPSNSSMAYAITCTGASRTTDSGATWEALAASHMTNFDPRSVVASPDGQTVFVAYASEGGEGKVQRSTDGGATWADVTPKNGPDSSGLGPLDNLFYVTGSEGRPQDGGLYMTGNVGLWFLPAESTQWKLTKNTDAGQGTNFQVTALWVDTAYNTTYDKPGPIIYEARADATAQTGQGIFRSADLGASWQPVGTGLGTHVVRGLALGSNNMSAGAVALETLVAATDDGVWTLPLRPSPR